MPTVFGGIFLRPKGKPKMHMRAAYSHMMSRRGVQPSSKSSSPRTGEFGPLGSPALAAPTTSPVPISTTTTTVGGLEPLPATTTTTNPADSALVQWAMATGGCTGAESANEQVQSAAQGYPGYGYQLLMGEAAGSLVGDTQECISDGVPPDQSIGTQHAWTSALNALLADGQALVSAADNDTSPTAAADDAASQLSTINGILEPIFSETDTGNSGNSGSCFNPSECSP